VRQDQVLAIAQAFDKLMNDGTDKDTSPPAPPARQSTDGK
jgi:hypothetical protein